MKHLSKKIILFSFLLGATTTINAQTIRFVKSNGTEENNAAEATSWATACADLQAVINVSEAGDEIWVAAGTFKPNRRVDAFNTITLNDRNNAFGLKKNVKIYGSFTGIETTLDQRQLPTSNDYTSILSGDFNDNDGDDFTNMDENAYHVVVSVGDVDVACLDGFTITGGNANGSYKILVDNFRTINQSYSGGMYNSYSSPTLSHINISENVAEYWGGGIYNDYHSSPILVDVNIYENMAYTGSGGGMVNSISSSPTLTNVNISGNVAGRTGGGMLNFVNSSPILTNVNIFENEADNDGGGIYNNGNCSPILTNVSISGNITNSSGGGMYNYDSSPTLVNVSISENAANNSGGGILNGWRATSILTNVSISKNTTNNNGGGIYNWESSPTLTNVTISRNTAENGGGMYNEYNSYPKVRNSIIWDNETTSNIYNDNSVPIYSYNLIEGVIAEGVILDGSDPLFVDATNGDFRLQIESPCINAGDKTLFEAGQTPDLSDISIDLSGNPRLYGSNIDLGAYEYQGEPSSIKISHWDGVLYIYPNPTIGEVYVESLSNENIVPTLKLYNLQGEQLYKTKNNKIDLSGYAQGVYLLQVKGKMVKVVKE